MGVVTSLSFIATLYFWLWQNLLQHLIISRVDHHDFRLQRFLSYIVTLLYFAHLMVWLVSRNISEAMLIFQTVA